MPCCIAIGLLISAVRRAYFAMRGREAPREEMFAPAARRPGPAAALETL